MISYSSFFLEKFPAFDEQFSCEDQLMHDRKSVPAAVANYNAAVQRAGELGDNGTFDMLTSILKDEEGHIDWH